MPFDKEKARKNLKEILKRMQNDTDALQLHEYYKIFKKEISFFRRSLAAAYLFMYYDGKEIPPISDPSSSVTDKPKKQATGNIASSRPAANALKQNLQDTSTNKESTDNQTNSVSFEKTLVVIPEEESKRLFISIGKNRRLFPREVIALIISNTSAAREDIGIIRILDNYSFVQVRDTKADEIIETLTGHRFRGRTLTVNYAKPKNIEENNQVSSAESSSLESENS